MKKILFLSLIFGFASTAFTDIALPPEMQKKQDQDWQNLICKDPKNLIQCEYSIPSPDPADCMQYRKKPKKFKFLARQGGASFGKEKYCRRAGKDQ